MLPMTPFAVFKKSRFSEVSGTLRRGPWGPSEVETEFFFKIFDGLHQTLQKSQFSEVSGDPSAGTLGTW